MNKTGSEKQKISVVCPVFNEAIADGKKVRIKEIDKDGMWGIGTPEDLNYFLEHYRGEI